MFIEVVVVVVVEESLPFSSFVKNTIVKTSPTIVATVVAAKRIEYFLRIVDETLSCCFVIVVVVVPHTSFDIEIVVEFSICKRENSLSLSLSLSQSHRDRFA